MIHMDRFARSVQHAHVAREPVHRLRSGLTPTEAHVMVDNKGGPDRTGMVQVELSREDREERGRALAAREQERFDLIDKKKTHNRKWNEDLIQLRESIRQLTEEVDTGMAWVESQTDMFGGGSANDTDEAEPEEEPKPRRGGRRGRRGARAADEGATAT